jgi:hypothetical protein
VSLRTGNGYKKVREDTSQGSSDAMATFRFKEIL